MTTLRIKRYVVPKSVKLLIIIITYINAYIEYIVRNFAQI